MNTERAAVLAETLAEFRHNRQTIRGVEIVSDCCSTCDLDSNREFALDAVPLLPHAYCTNPDGCHCDYSPVLISAPTPPEDFPSAYPSLVIPTAPPPSGLPAYLKTPTAALIALGAIVITWGIGLINMTTSTRTGTGTGTSTSTEITRRTPSRSPARVTQTARMTQTAEAPPAAVSGPTRNGLPDREAAAKAARDLREADANAKANESARIAQMTAAQQQTYLRNIFSQQAASGGNHGGRRLRSTTESAVSASSPASP